MLMFLLFCIALAVSIAHVYVFHLATCREIELRFNKQYDAMADANRKLSAENESLRAGYRAMFPHLHECGWPHTSEIERIRKLIEAATSAESTGGQNG